MPAPELLKVRLTLTWGEATPTQRIAWRRLWARLLEPKIAQLQNRVGAGVATCATAANGHNSLSERNNDSTDHIPRT
jgi:hypothetical protein